MYDPIYNKDGSRNWLAEAMQYAGEHWKELNREERQEVIDFLSKDERPKGCYPMWTGLHNENF